MRKTNQTQTGAMKMKQIILKEDGNMVCAIWDDFIDLQVSPAGFGENIKEAVSNLIGEPHTYSPSIADKDFCIFCGDNFRGH